MPAPKAKSNRPEYTMYNGRNVKPCLIGSLRGAVYDDGDREPVCDENGNYLAYKAIPRWTGE